MINYNDRQWIVIRIRIKLMIVDNAIKLTIRNGNNKVDKNNI